MSVDFQRVVPLNVQGEHELESFGYVSGARFFEVIMLDSFHTAGF